MENNKEIEKIDNKFLENESRIQKRMSKEKEENDGKIEKIDGRKYGNPGKLEEFLGYVKVSAFVGTAYGLLFGWMWGIKGLIIGPLMGFLAGVS